MNSVAAPNILGESFATILALMVEFFRNFATFLKIVAKN